MKPMQALLTGDEGVTAIEYGMIAAVLAVAIVVAVASIGNKLSAVFDGISNKVVTP